jgi:hypothetical protein
MAGGLINQLYSSRSYPYSSDYRIDCFDSQINYWPQSSLIEYEKNNGLNGLTREF